LCRTPPDIRISLLQVPPDEQFAYFSTVTKSATSQAERKTLRVLIADDTAAIRESLSALVARLDGIEIVGLAEDGTKALELIRSLKPDVATLDIRMPGINGIKVLENINREQLPVAVIVMTGLGEAEYREKCLALGAKHFFHKSTEFEMVIDVLKQYAANLNTSPPPTQQ
jgi:DNA-binding NarL/FixJ family response regulator